MMGGEPDWFNMKNWKYEFLTERVREEHVEKDNSFWFL